MNGIIGPEAKVERVDKEDEIGEIVELRGQMLIQVRRWVLQRSGVDRPGPLANSRVVDGDVLGFLHDLTYRIADNHAQMLAAGHRA